MLYVVQQDEAIQCFDEIIRLEPIDLVNSNNVYYNKGIVLNELKKYDTIFQEATAFYKLKRYDEAILHYEKAIETEPNNPLAYFNKGNALYSLKRYAEAIQCYDKVIQLDPNYSEAYYQKGIASDDLEKYNAAIELYDKAIQLNPKDSLAYIQKGNALRN